MKKKNAIAIIIIVVIVIGLTVGLLFIFLPFGREYIGQRKALICASANDFFGSEPEDDFNGGHDSNLDNPTKGEGNWSYHNLDNSYGDYDGGIQSLSVVSLAPGSASGSYLLNYSAPGNYPLYDYIFYNMTADVFIQSPHPIGGMGIQIGLIWLDSGANIVREDWSVNVSSQLNQWFTLNVTGVCNNETGNEITDLVLALKVNISQFLPPGDVVYFDNIKIYKWVLVDLQNPTNPGTTPPPAGINSDGFPAQGLQVYWILKNHGYTDENIFFMLYYKDDVDGIIDISLFDTYANDLIHDGIPAVIDVANDSVTAARFKQELDVSYTGSFASGIHPEDYLIIFMCDHGSNQIIGQVPNATFHFEADNSFITELEFYNLVKQIECQRMMINVDCCFSGNFLNQNVVGNSWYDIENCIMVSASSNLLAWYYINNRNPDGFAGSWFFHWFWDVLDHDGSILDAYNFASTWPPAVRPMPLFVIQNPMMYDYMGLNTTSFVSDPPL